MLEEGIFPEDRKKGNVGPIQKKREYKFDKVIVQLVFLLSSVKSLKGVDSVLCIITLCKTNFLQSDFIPGDSCIAQLLSITHEIYENFDCNLPADTRRTFLDISKAIDKVWHGGLIFKLKIYGLEGSVLGPILFLIYINDLPDGIKSICKIFADDTSLFSEVKDKNCSTVELNNHLKVISTWAIQWKMLFNPDPNKDTVKIPFSKKHEKDNYSPLNFIGDNVQTAITQKDLDLVLDSKLDFNEHISNKINKCNKMIRHLKETFSFSFTENF